MIGALLRKLTAVITSLRTHRQHVALSHAYRAILIEASLSFLGLGAQPPTPSWGNMLNEGKAFMRRAWWVMTFPGLAIFITVLAFNLLGDGLREALDPRLRGR